MLRHLPPSDFATRIQQLLEQRQHHDDAITRIDEALAGVGAALGSGPGTMQRPPKQGSIGQASTTEAEHTSGKKRRRKRNSFATTAQESILAFVKQQKNPTSREIEQHWKGERRGGLSSNTLSKLVKDRKLKRTPLGKGVQGSRYTLL